jgi:hypothetical protein
MTETNGFYPLLPRRHENDCDVCLEPQFCDCLCETCKASREKWFSSKEYDKYIKDVIDPRD